MADSDNSLDILINILTRQLGEQKAQDILKQVKESTASANDENERYQATLEKMRVAQVMENQEAEKGVKWTQSRNAGAADLSGTLAALKKNVVEGKKAVEDEEEAARHSMSTHAQLKGALKGVATQFPELAHAAHLALNPITLSIAAIVGSVAVWKHRNEELTKSLGGIEMTAFGEDQVSRIERIGAAMTKMAEAKAGQTGFAKIKSEASSADTSKYLFTKRNTQDEYAIVYGFNAGKYEFYSETFTGSNPRTPLAATLSDSLFHNIIWTYDGSNLKGYWDGTLSTNRSITFSLTTGNGNLILGSSTGFANNFSVTVDDLRIWYRVLTDPEIAQLQTQQ